MARIYNLTVRVAHHTKQEPKWVTAKSVARALQVSVLRAHHALEELAKGFLVDRDVTKRETEYLGNDKLEA